MPYEWVRIQGRWRSDCVREYLDMIGQETREFTRKVATGTGLRLADDDPGSLHQLQRPERKAQVWAAASQDFRLRQLRFARSRR